MDFAALPPEITSAQICSGPGPGSLIEASTAWRRTGTELEYSANSYASVLSSLIEAWRGPSSTAMTQAAEPFLTWLQTTAQQCLQTSSATQAAAAAFTSARLTMVPPAAVSANRTRLAQLIATNLFLSNLPAIAETEAEYEGMWANNSAAMSRYAAASAQAVTVPQFSSAPSVASPAGLAAQASAVPAATSTGAASAATSTLSSLTSFDPNSGWFGFVSNWVQSMTNGTVSSGIPINLLSMFSTFWTAQAVTGVGGQIAKGLVEGQAALGGPLGGLGQMSAANLLSAVGPAGQAAAPTAALGAGVTVGKLTAPPAVVGLLPASESQVRLVSAVSPLPSGSGLPSIPMLPIAVPPPASLGSGWRKRRKPEEDVEFGLELPKPVMPKHPSAG